MLVEIAEAKKMYLNKHPSLYEQSLKNPTFSTSFHMPNAYVILSN